MLGMRRREFIGRRGSRVAARAWAQQKRFRDSVF